MRLPPSDVLDCLTGCSQDLAIPSCFGMISLRDLYNFRPRGIGEWPEHQRIGLRTAQARPFKHPGIFEYADRRTSPRRQRNSLGREI